MSQHRARKRFGQHFLTDSATISKIVSAIAPRPGESIVEIGPGQAAITTPLAACATTLHTIEFDRDLAVALQRRFSEQKHVFIHECDALQFDFSSLGERLRIVGNLPYNISTPLLFHLLTHRQSIADMHFMLQKEVVDRMAAKPGGKEYGRLTIMLACEMDVVPLFDVPPEAFSPPPKVLSSVVRMRPLAERAYAISDREVLAQTVRLAFSRRRKTLRNALQGIATESDICAAGLEPAKRPEQIDVEGWVALANKLAAQKEPAPSQ